jgi:hypothetical protein
MLVKIVTINLRILLNKCISKMIMGIGSKMMFMKLLISILNNINLEIKLKTHLLLLLKKKTITK